jgi:hypothetical protein
MKLGGGGVRVGRIDRKKKEKRGNKEGKRDNLKSFRMKVRNKQECVRQGTSSVLKHFIM